ncbi:MAG: hypothetical protein ACPGGK_00670 [Pikeienuella sp.]
MAGHESFLVLNRFRWLKLAVVLCVAVVAAYMFYQPLGGHNGGTILGYGLGSLGLLLILWLAWLGVKKRGFSGGTHKMRGWTSAHVYLGLSLTVVATAHTGLEFGWNVHTLGYTLMMLVILSGIFGIMVYAKNPAKMSANMNGASAVVLRSEMSDIDARLARLVQRLPDSFAEAARASLDGTIIGGNFMRLLSGSNSSCGSAKGRDIATLAAKSLSDETQREASDEFIEALTRKAEIAAILRRDLKLKAVMDAWLFLHVPLTIGLIATLTAHVIIVFFFW